MIRKIFGCLAVALLLAIAVAPVSAASILFGANDNPPQPTPPPSYERNGDFEDAVGLMMANNLQVHSLGWAAWQPMPAPNETCTPYYSCPSGDGPEMNIGYFVTRSGGWEVPGIPAIPASSFEVWLGFTDDRFYMTADGKVSVMFLAAITSGRDTNVFGYVNLNDGIEHILIPGGAPFDSYSFTPDGPFALFFGQPASLSRSDVNPQQFALFRPAGGSEVPEPATIVLFGGGLLAFTLIRRRRAAKL